MIQHGTLLPAVTPRAADAGGTPRRVLADAERIQLARWPDFTESMEHEYYPPVGVDIRSAVTHPLGLHIALATLRLIVMHPGDALLRLAVEPADPAMHLSVVRSLPGHHAPGASGNTLDIPLSGSGTRAVQVDLRLDGNQVGRVPPVLNVWASVRSAVRESIDEAIAARRLVPMVVLADDLAFPD